MQKENKNQLTSSRKVVIRDINALLQTAPISRIKTLRDDEGRSKSVGQVLPDNKGCSLFNLINPSRGLRAFRDYDLPGRRLPARGEENAARGFTLIELLVVVLIIGILAAVALPQYQLAVMKSRFTSFMPMVDAIARAEEVYYLANGEYTKDPRNLDVEFSTTSSITYSGASVPKFNYENFACKIDDTASVVYCSGDNYGYYGRYFKHSDYPNQRVCYAQLSRADADLRKRLCLSLGGVPHDDIEEGWIYYFLP